MKLSSPSSASRRYGCAATSSPGDQWLFSGSSGNVQPASASPRTSLAPTGRTARSPPCTRASCSCGDSVGQSPDMKSVIPATCARSTSVPLHWPSAMTGKYGRPRTTIRFPETDACAVAPSLGVERRSSGNAAAPGAARRAAIIVPTMDLGMQKTPRFRMLWRSGERAVALALLAVGALAVPALWAAAATKPSPEQLQARYNNARDRVVAYPRDRSAWAEIALVERYDGKPSGTLTLPTLASLPRSAGLARAAGPEDRPLSRR